MSRERFRSDHRWAPGRMSAYLDEELDANRRARMERHVRECVQCRRLLASLRLLLEALRRLPAPLGGPDSIQLAESVRLRLRESPPHD